MKGCFFAGLLFSLVALAGQAAEAGFSQALSAKDFRAAGLDLLTPAQRAHLDELVAAFKQGLVTTARQSAEEAQVAKQKADQALAAQRVAEAEAKAARQEAEVAKHEANAAKAEAAEGKAGAKGFWTKAKVMVVPGTQIEYAEIKSTILGQFEGWDDRDILRLANGQRWQIANPNEHYFTPPSENVEVAVRPAALGGFWMYFPAFNKRVRVKLLSDK